MCSAYVTRNLLLERIVTNAVGDYALTFQFHVGYLVTCSVSYSTKISKPPNFFIMVVFTYNMSIAVAGKLS